MRRVIESVKRLLGCTHKNLSWPRTRKSRKKGQSVFYRCCLDCGEELDYRLGELIFAQSRICAQRKKSVEVKELKKLMKLGG